MQKVVGSSPIIRSKKPAGNGGSRPVRHLGTAYNPVA